MPCPTDEDLVLVFVLTLHALIRICRAELASVIGI